MRKVLYTLTVSVYEDQDPADPLPDATDDRNIERTIRHALHGQIVQRARLDAEVEVVSHELVDVVTHAAGYFLFHRRGPHDRVTTDSRKVDCPRCLDTHANTPDRAIDAKGQS